MLEGGRVCSLHISSDRSDSRGEEKEEDSKNMVRWFFRDVHEVYSERLFGKYVKEEEYERFVVGKTCRAREFSTTTTRDKFGVVKLIVWVIRAGYLIRKKLL